MANAGHWDLANLSPQARGPLTSGIYNPAPAAPPA
jgi:hypothetical protein